MVRTAEEDPALAIILGTNEFASAVAVHLWAAGWTVVMCDDPDLPVIRRRMAFHDVLHGDFVWLGGVSGHRIDHPSRAVVVALARHFIILGTYGLRSVRAVTTPDAVVDARMNRHVTVSDLRSEGGVSIGLGPGYEVGRNCDVAIETHPDRTGAVLTYGRTLDADGLPPDLGSLTRERFVYAPVAGRWHTPLDIGSKVTRGTSLGHLAGQQVLAPVTGILRGSARDGIDVPQGVKLIEIDPRRTKKAQWCGIYRRGAAIAGAVVTLLSSRADVTSPVTSDLGRRS